MFQSSIFRVITVLVFASVLFAGSALARTSEHTPLYSGEYVQGQIIVKFRPSARVALNSDGAKTYLQSVDALGDRFHVSKVKSILKEYRPSSSLNDVYTVHFPESEDVRDVIKAYEKNPYVEYAEPNYIMRALYTPDDPQYPLQWNFDLVNVPEAWDQDTTAPDYGGDPSIVVAVVDTGVAYEDFGSFAQAPDLALTNFTSGYDFIDDDAHPNDDNGHGTHVTGTIAQSTNNTTAVAGIAFNTTIMPVKVLAADGEGTVVQVAAGIDFATANGADIINMSLGAPADDEPNTLRTAVDAAVNAGILVVAATGNGGEDGIGDPLILYPAAFSNVIAVGAVDQDQSISGYSNYGANLDFVAPGGDGTGDLATWIYQQTFSNVDGNGAPLDYTTFGTVGYQGTSMAAPHVSAAAALLMASGVPASSVEERLIDSATDLGDSGYDTVYGHGLIDINGAMSSVVTTDTTAPMNGTITGHSDSNHTRDFITEGRANDRTPYFRWDAATDASGIEGYYVLFGTDNSLDPVTEGTFQTGRTYTPSELTETYDAVTYYLRIRARDGAGNNSSATEQFIYVLDTGVSQPGGLRSASTTSGIRLSWDAVTNENLDHYTLWRSTSSDADSFAKLAESPSASYTMGNVPDGTRYFFHITAVDDLGNESGRTGGAHEAIFHQEQYIVVGAGSDGGPQVRVFKADGTLVSQFFAYATDFRGGVNVATGDLDGDGTTEIITGTGPGGGPQVRVFDVNGNVKFNGGFMAYATTVRNGVYVGAGDINGDGRDEIVTGTGSGSGSHVRIFDRNGNVTVNSGFFAYDSWVRNGVFVATGDLNNDGKDEIITGTGVGSGPHVRIWGDDGIPVFNAGFFPYAATFRGGVRVGTGDVNGNGNLEIITSPGTGGGPIVQAFDRNGSLKVAPFEAFAADFRGGTFVAGGDTTQNGKANIIVAVGAQGNPTVKVYNSTGTSLEHQFDAFATTFKGGINIATGVLKE